MRRPDDFAEETSGTIARGDEDADEVDRNGSVIFRRLIESRSFKEARGLVLFDSRIRLLGCNNPSSASSRRRLAIVFSRPSRIKVLA